MVKMYLCVMVTPLHCLEAFTTNNNCASSLSSVVTSSSFCANGPGTLQCRIECSTVSVGRGKFGLNSFHYALLLSGPKVNKNYFSSHQSLEVVLLVVVFTLFSKILQAITEVFCHILAVFEFFVRLHLHKRWYFL